MIDTKTPIVAGRADNAESDAREKTDWERDLDRVAQRELLLLGEGQLAYVRPVAVPVGDEDTNGETAPRKIATGLGVFSATGSLLAVCDGMERATAFAMQNNLVLVPRQ